MASETKTILAAFFDDGAYTPLFGAGKGAVEVGFGLVGGSPAYAVCQNGEAVDAADVALCCKATELAAKTGNPVATFYNSKGAKLEGGIASLTAAAKLNEAAAKISGVVPQIAVVTGVCGASSAMAAANADICVMAKDAELFLTAPFISEVAGDKVAGAGSAEFAVQAGVASLVADDAEAAAREAAKLLMLLPGNNLSTGASFEYAAPTAPLAKAEGMDAVEALADDGSAVELNAGFGGAVVTALATVSGAAVGIVATNGPETQLGNHCITKVARFVRLCDAYSIPVVTVVNTGGFAKSSTSDEAGAIRGAARLAATYADATTAKVAVLAGKAVGTAYTALANADLTVALRGCVVTPAEPAAAVTVLYKQEIDAAEGSIEAETAKRAAAYAEEVGGADALLAAGAADFVADATTARAQVAAALDILVSKRTQRIAKKHGNMAL